MSGAQLPGGLTQELMVADPPTLDENHVRVELSNLKPLVAALADTADMAGMLASLRNSKLRCGELVEYQSWREQGIQLSCHREQSPQ